MNLLTVTLRQLGPKVSKKGTIGAEVKERGVGDENMDCKDNRRKQGAKGQLGWVRESTDVGSGALSSTSCTFQRKLGSGYIVSASLSDLICKMG